MKILGIVNPISGGVNKEPFLVYLEKELDKYGYDYRIYKTTGQNDAEAIKDLMQSFIPDRVLSMGGDGTTLFTAQHIMEFEVPMGIIPFGSANGMAVELGVNADQKTALSDFLKSQIVRGLDLIKVNGEHYCLHIGDIGLNAQIVKGFSQDKARGMLTYAKHFVKQLEISQPIAFRITANGEQKQIEAHMLAIANSRKYGTGVILNHLGNPFDGKLELVAITKIDTAGIVRAGLTAIDESFYNTDNITTISCEEAMIELDQPETLQLDGEVIGPVTKIDLQIMPGAIQLITSKLNPFIK